MIGKEELLKQIDVDKEVLETLPKNTIKNKKIYVEKLREIEEKYKAYDKDITNEISKKINALEKKYSFEKKEISRAQVDELQLEKLYVSDACSSYEKLDLDYLIHDLTYYYKNNLSVVNEKIIAFLEKFSSVGIALELDEFHYNTYVKEYFETLYHQIEAGKIDNDVLGEKFEKIYWKCPEIIAYIEMNLRYAYENNEKRVDYFFAHKKSEVLNKYDTKELELVYANAKKEFIEKVLDDPKKIVSQLVNGELKVKDYSKDSINKIIEKYVANVAEMDTQAKNEAIQTLLKLRNSLYEYKNYLKFKFLVDKMIEIYNDLLTNKTNYINLVKSIQKNEKEIVKLGTEKKSFFRRKSKNQADQTKLLTDTKELYKKADVDKIVMAIDRANISAKSSLYDVLNLCPQYYNFIFNCLINKEDGIQEKEIFDFVQELKEFVNWPYFTIINNIKVGDEKDIMFIIKDKYNLLNINLTKEDLEGDNLDSLIESLNTLETFYYINKNGINLDDIKDLIEFKKLLDK